LNCQKISPKHILQVQQTDSFDGENGATMSKDEVISLSNFTLMKVKVAIVVVALN
jgi:hypothetical protein